MPLEFAALRRCLRGAEIVAGQQLCRAELDSVRAALDGGAPVLLACTQEAPLFETLAGERDGVRKPKFVNIRETAGWSKDARAAAPKIAALLAAASLPEPEPPTFGIVSEGTTLVYGRDARALEAAELLKDHVSVTLLLETADDVLPPRRTEFALFRGRLRSAKGCLGKFEVVVDGCVAPEPSSRDRLVFGTPRNDVAMQFDILLDLSGRAPLFPASDLRDGYLRADPADAAAILRAVLKARDLVGHFDKPLYVNFTADLCAHSRSNIVGCRRCLDLCPTGAIAPQGDHVAIDPRICAGCGQCAAACPTGAAAYALPSSDVLLRRLRALLSTYRSAGGRLAVLLFHDREHGIVLIDALARYGDGLPANVIPVEVNEVTQIGIESIAAAFAYGASAVRFLLRSRPRHDVAGLRRTLALAEPILGGLGFAGERVATIETDDPDGLAEALRAIVPMDGTDRPASFLAAGEKRDVVRLALRELHAAAPAPVDVIPLPDGAPFGKIEVEVEGCTLCLSCVSACPTGALSDDPERPMLRFAEDACVQCGLCRATCPEKVIRLRPQIDFRAATAGRQTIKEEEPYHCIRCGAAFGVKSTIERVIAKLEKQQHWMYKDSAKRLDVVRMCADCRIAAMVEEEFDPFGAPPRPRLRTTDDYLRERELNRDTEKSKRDTESS
ncbi:MAG: 4Fe-4S dicluster domain-containing protein [Pseudolabrys sp.]|nr:4Fe-4S dicluster domain-containing protein [Pseudolabrys sp.]